jgi:hypothetical protein
VSRGTSPRIQRLCFRWKRTGSFTCQLLYPAPEERATGAHWLGVLIDPLYLFCPPITGYTDIIYSHFHPSGILYLTFWPSKMRLLRCPETSGTNHPVTWFLFAEEQRSQQSLFFRYLVALFVPWSPSTSLHLRSVDVTAWPCSRSHGREDFPLYTNFQLDSVCHHKTIARFYASRSCGQVLSKFRLTAFKARQVTTFVPNDVRYT